MINNRKRLFSISMILPVGLLFFLLFFSQSHRVEGQPECHMPDSGKSQVNCSKEENTEIEKQKGAHVFGIFDTTNLEFLNRSNIEWVTLVAWSNQENCESPLVRHHNGDSLLIQSSDSNWVRRIHAVRSSGFKVFVKPHVWINNPAPGKWRSDIFPTSPENWTLWKNSYRDFIIRYATIAEMANAEMFCVGTEFSRLSIEKPNFWKELILEVRSIYSGKITYAANWYNEYRKISFWEELDYIGIQAYFPLTKSEYPEVDQIAKGWNKFLPSMEAIHKKYDRKILFTEIGYKSTADSAIDPWSWMEHPGNGEKPFSIETQANCYTAFFETIWPKDWFAGAHIWQLRTDFKKRPGRQNKNFTPQGKPAEQIIAKGFE